MRKALVPIVVVVALGLGGCQYLSAEEFDKYVRSHLDLLTQNDREKNPDRPYLESST